MKVSVLAAALAVLATPAVANDLIVKRSAHGVKETLDRLTTGLGAKGITPLARVDHAAGAEKVGTTLLPTEVLMFGNPALGTPLIQSKRTVALDLPMKVLAWQDTKGSTWVAYTSADALRRRYGVVGQREPIAKMTAALAGFVADAVKSDTPKPATPAAAAPEKVVPPKNVPEPAPVAKKPPGSSDPALRQTPPAPQIKLEPSKKI